MSASFSTIRRRLLGPAAVCLALSTALWPLAVAGQTSSVTGLVSGRVTDETGAPAAHLEVTAWSGGRAVARTASNGQGRYSLAVPAGELRVSIDGQMGWTSVESDALDVGNGDTVVVDLTVARRIYDTEAIVVTASGPGGQPTLDGVPGMVGIVGAQEMRRRPTVNPVDQIQGQPGVDLAPTGVGGRIFAFRGNNNIFTGAVRYLVDYRPASLPSLRANFTHFVPTASLDMERMELILGPSSALYGPNAANGVLNTLTRSPLDLPETSVSVAGGTQSVFESEARTSQRIGERFGFKLSGRWFQAQEYPYLDPVEDDVRSLIEDQPETFRAQLRDIGVPDADIAARESRAGIRNRDVERWSVDARADWTPSEGDTLFFQAGRTSTTGLELTPLGAAQAGGWHYDYLQARVQSGPLFAQAFLNRSEAGETYLLRDGAPLFDESRLFGTQLRHAFSFADGRQEITYGGDWVRTDPRTGGTIHGQFEDDDVITEYGGYVQSRTRIAEGLQFIGTIRLDESNVIEDPVVSPRVGIVFEPGDGHSFSASWSRGFSTPTPTNYFLDLSAGAAPGILGALGYRIRARGTGREGIRFSNGQGGFQGMRSPCTPPASGGPSQLVPATSTVMWQCAVGLLQQQGVLDDPTSAYLRSLDPGGQVGVNAFDPVTETLSPLTPGSVEDIAPLGENTTSTLELGYRGLLGDRLFLQAGVWHTRRQNFTSPLLLRTPLLTLDGEDLAAYLAANGVAPEQAGAIAGAVAPIPLGVLSSEDIAAQGAELIATYENFGTLTYWGYDIGGRAELSRHLTLSGSLSWISDDHFEVDERLVPLNAPALKGTLALAVANLPAPVTGDVRVRHHSGFPVSSGDYVGTACLGVTGSLVEDCVDAATLLDLSLGLEDLMGSGLALRVNATNLLGTSYRPFVGVPIIGRQLLTRLEYRLR